MNIGLTPWLHKNSVAVIKPLRYKKSNFLGSHHMIDNSLYLICFLNKLSGGAVRNFEYAKSKHYIKSFNIAL